MLLFDYDHDIPTLQRLITLSNRAQWTPEDIEWTKPLSRRGGEYEPILEWHGLYRNEYVQSLSPMKREELARQFVAYEFSQILHGEQAALMLAGQLTSSVSDLDARIFAANQARDEARHVQAVRALVERIGPIYSCGPVLEKNLVELLECTMWPKQVLGLQLFLEARALLSFRQTLLFVRDSVFKDATTRIERDEAHHVAFGIQYLKTGIDELSEVERAELVAYARHLDQNLWVMTQQPEFRAAFEEIDLDFDECFRCQNASFMTPALGLEKAETVENMHKQFTKWFQNATRRVGLGEAFAAPAEAEARAAAVDPAEEDPSNVESVMPWLGAR